MNAAATFDKEIAQYPTNLNIKQKKTVLTVAKTFARERNDWWDEIGLGQQHAIDKALVEMKAGKLTPQDEVMKTYAKWLK